MEALSASVVVVLQNYGLTWQHFPSADLTVAGIGAIVLRTKLFTAKNRSPRFHGSLRGPAAAHPRTNLTFPLL
jgi:hypothetical protein